MGKSFMKILGTRMLRFRAWKGCVAKKLRGRILSIHSRELLVPHSFLLAAKAAVRSQPVHGRTEYSGAAG